MRAPKVRNINLNTKQEDGTFQIAGIADPETAGSYLAPWSNGSGSYVYYGAYPQGRDGDGGFRTEPVKWRVLDADTIDFDGERAQNHTMLLWSDKVLDGQIFNENVSNEYAESQVRNWLNSTGQYAGNGFCDTAFTREEKMALAISRKSGSGKTDAEGDILYRGQKIYKDNSGLSQKGTEDRCFLLSAEEMYCEAYGFYGEINPVIRVPDNPANRSTLLEATEYAAETASGVAPYYNHMVRSADAATDIFVGIVSFYGACTRKSYKDVIGISPACSLDLSQVLFTSDFSCGKAKTFARTEECKGEAGWKLTLLGGSGFTAVPLSELTGDAKTSWNLRFQVTDLGDVKSEAIQYDRISAMLVSSDGTVVCYGKVGEAFSGEISIALPDGLSAGRYSLQLFAEDARDQQGTDFASDIAEFSLVLRDPSNQKVSEGSSDLDLLEKQFAKSDKEREVSEGTIMKEYRAGRDIEKPTEISARKIIGKITGKHIEKQMSECSENPTRIRTEKTIEKQVDRYEGKQAENLAENQTEPLVENQIEKLAGSQTEQPAGNQTEKPTGSQVEKPVENQTEQPAGSQVEKPAENQTEKPAGNQTEKLAGSRVEKPVENQTEQLAGSQTEKPAGSQVEKPVGNQTEQPARSQTEQPAENQTEQPAGSQTEQPTGSQVEKPVENQTEQPAENQVENSVGKCTDKYLEKQAAESAETQSKEYTRKYAEVKMEKQAAHIQLKAVRKNGKIRLSWNGNRSTKEYVVYGARGQGRMKRLCTLNGGKCGCVFTNMRKDSCYHFCVSIAAEDGGEPLAVSEVVCLPPMAERPNKKRKMKRE